MEDFWQHVHTFNTNQARKPLLIHVVSYQRVTALNCLLNCLANQTEQNFDVCITHDDFHYGTLDMVQHWAQRHHIQTTLKFTRERMNQWGHPMRAKVIEECAHDYMLLTNDDNYYVPVFTQIMMHNLISQDAHMVMCDMIHSHNNPGSRQQPPYSLFVTEPRCMHCDIGCFIIDTKLAQQVGFHNCEISWADGLFVDAVMQLNSPTTKCVKVPQVLFVHN